MAVRFGGLPVEQVFDSNGDPLAGAKLSFFDTGTSTPHNTFSDDALTTPNANPVVADSAGRFGAIFLDNADYKVILKTSADVTIWTADPVHGGPANPLFSAISVKSGNYTILSGDNGKLIPVTATATITLPAATVGATFRVGIVNAGAGIVTVARAGADTIGTGLTSLKLASNQGAFFQSDGTSKFYVVGFDGRGKGADVASAATLNIGEDGDYFHVTGTTTITAIEGRPTGFEITLEFDGALQLTHNAVSLILFGGQNFTTVAGDILKLRSEADGGNWRLMSINGQGQIIGWPEDTAPDAANDYLQTWDASANALKKVKIRTASVSVIDKNGTTPAIVNTITETSTYSVTVKGGALGANGAVRVTILGEYLNNSGAGATVTLRVKFGGVTIYQDVTASIATSALTRPFRLDFFLSNRNSTGLNIMTGRVHIGNIVAATTGAGDLATDGLLSTMIDSNPGGSIDTTLDQVFDVTIQHSVANANINWTRTYVVTELI